MQTHRRNSIGFELVGARVRTLLAVAATAGAFAVLAALPPGSSSGWAGTQTSSAATLTSGLPGLTLPVSLELPTSELETILSSLPIANLGLGSTELEQVLAEASERVNPLLGGLLGKVQTVVENLLAGNPQATVGEAVSTVDGLLSGLLGKSVNLGDVLEGLSPEQASKALEGLLSPEGIEKLLTGLAGKLGELGSEGATELRTLLTDLLGALPGGTGALQGEVQKTLEEVGKTGLHSLLEAVESTGVLSGEALALVERLLGEMGTLSASALQEDVAQLLGTLTPTELSALIGTLLGTLDPTQLQGIVGDLLGGVTGITSTKTLSELASAAGTSTEQVANELGTTASSLPETLPAVSAVLGKEGPVVSLVDDAGKLLGSLAGEGSGSTSGSGDSGGSGGAGGSGSSGAGGGSGLTLMVNVPATQAASQVTPATAAASTAQKAASGSAAKAAKFAILSHRVNGNAATVVLRIPAAGRLLLSGKDMKSNTRNVLRAQRMVVKMKLAKAGIASLSHHRSRTLKVRLKAAFSPVHGTHATASAVLTFRPRSA